MKSPDEFEAQERRVEAIAGDEDGDGERRWLAHLRKALALPCEVTGIEDFRWEEPYALGVWSETEYRRLRKTQPCYKDVFILESLEESAGPQWALDEEDIGAKVRRKSDGARFRLGLSELKTVAEGGPFSELLDDYSCWFVNYR
jgi:hypothetical protein